MIQIFLNALLCLPLVFLWNQNNWIWESDGLRLVIFLYGCDYFLENSEIIKGLDPCLRVLTKGFILRLSTDCICACLISRPYYAELVMKPVSSCANYHVYTFHRRTWIRNLLCLCLYMYFWESALFYMFKLFCK